MKAHYLFHNNPSLLPISPKVNQFPTLLHVLQQILKLSPPRILPPHSWLFSSEFQAKNFLNHCSVFLKILIIKKIFKKITQPILKLSSHRILPRQSDFFSSEFQTKHFPNHCSVLLKFSIIKNKTL
jgi:hypothetical protein